MIELKVPLDVSILLDNPSNISLYVGENELPSYSVTIVELVRDWIDCVTVADRIHEAHVDEAYELIKHLRQSIEILTVSLPQ